MSNKRIDLTQFDAMSSDTIAYKASVNGEEPMMTQKEAFWDTWVLNEQQAAEGKALAVFTMDMQKHVCLIEGYDTAEEGLANANAIAKLPKLIAELRRCYELLDAAEETYETIGICLYCDACETEHESHCKFASE